MRLIYWSSAWTIAADFLAWMVIHLSISYAAYRIPVAWFDVDRPLFRTRQWEKNGQIWQQLTRVRSWKRHLPDGAALFRQGFRKKTMQRDQGWYRLFVLESRRAELTHWISLLPAPLFFLWNSVWVGWIMIGYAILVNLPCVIAQRYNRPRFAARLNKAGHHTENG
ncbi:MAG: hypothetical protein PHP94_00045 [Eubacteriales bacterium]|nr:hypothetical protein [Eubacteriales bacterium]MDD4460689.1 hypothetical protein [Eubacteriales bacterium]